MPAVTQVTQMNPEDLQTLLDENIAKARLQAHLNRFYNVLVGVKDIARFYNVDPHTVTNYVKDGLIVPEVKSSENEHPKFRLSYVLTLDFDELRRQLRAQKR